MKVRRPYAFCCIEGGGRVNGCTCRQPEHGYALVDVRAMLPGDEPIPSDAVRDLIEWARREQAFPVGNPGGEGRGHIDENHRFKLRDMLDAIDAATPKPPAGGDAGADAADILDHYARFIRDEVKADDLERHPYLPHIEQVAADLRAALALPAPVVEGEVEKLREEVTRLRKIAMPLWFYPADGHESDSCMWSVDEVIDYADLPPGDHVVEVNAATPLPSIWCAVRVTADEDADERHTFTEHDSAAAARAALSEGRSHG